MYKFFRIIYPGALINNAYVDDKTVMYTYVCTGIHTVRVWACYTDSMLWKSQMHERGCSNLEFPLWLEVR